MRELGKQLGVVLVCAAAASTGLGCVTVAEFRKLERQVTDMQRGRGSSDARESLADLSSQIDQLEGEVRQLRGRLEVAEKAAEDALVEARKARQGAAAVGAPRVAAALPVSKSEEKSEEVTAYREAYAKWRENDYAECIDRFRKFLQTYSASPYADDAAFWMADCHFKQGDFKNAVLRFDDVVRNYPSGNKAPDALYRQGESLLRLGPAYHEAAKRAFERVVKEYPDSARSREASRQIKLLAAS